MRSTTRHARASPASSPRRTRRSGEACVRLWSRSSPGPSLARDTDHALRLPRRGASRGISRHVAGSGHLADLREEVADLPARLRASAGEHADDRSLCGRLQLRSGRALEAAEESRVGRLVLVARRRSSTISERSRRCESRCSSSARTRTHYCDRRRACGPPTEPGWRSSPTRTISSARAHRVGKDRAAWLRGDRSDYIAPTGCAEGGGVAPELELDPGDGEPLELDTDSGMIPRVQRNNAAAVALARGEGYAADHVGGTLGARPALRERAIVAAVAIAVLLLLGLAGCSRTPAPGHGAQRRRGPRPDRSRAARARGGARKVVDQGEQEDDLYGDALSPEYDVELEVSGHRGGGARPASRSSPT